MKLTTAVREVNGLRYFAARQALILIGSSLGTFKVARISFGVDGSIYVQFPYLKYKHGIVCELPVNPDERGPVTYQLGRLGVEVSTDVKFSHHRSGIAQFSKSGLDARLPRRSSFPLDGPIGWLFQLNAYWLSGFCMLERTKSKDLHLGFGFPRKHPGGVVVTAQWRRKVDIIANMEPQGGKSGPAAEVMSRHTRARSRVYFLGQPDSSPLTDHVLMISGGEVPVPKNLELPAMVFLGGWDRHEVTPATPEARRAECLAFMYPSAGQGNSEATSA